MFIIIYYSVNANGTNHCTGIENHNHDYHPHTHKKIADFGNMEPEVIYNKVQIMLQLEFETFFKHESVLLSYIEQQ